MLTPEFGELFDELIVAFGRYHDASRHADDVCELARRRFALERARRAIARERELIEAAQQTADDRRWLAAVGISVL